MKSNTRMKLIISLGFFFIVSSIFNNLSTEGKDLKGDNNGNLSNPMSSDYWICLNHSNWNIILNNTFTGNTINIYNSSDCIGNILQAGGNGGIMDDDDEDDDDSAKDPEDNLFLIIIIVLGCAITGSIGGLIVVKKKKGEKEVSEKKKVLKTKEPKTDLKIKEPKAELKPKKIKEVPKKPKRISEAPPPPLDLTKIEKEELEKTEEEVGVEKQKFICIVHKGPVEGDNYLCPNCQTFYCVCAKALKDKGEKCWSYDSEIVFAETKIEVQDRIRELESRMDSLKTTVKNLDENFYAGDIEKEEYSKMKDSLQEKIGNLIAEIKRLKEESFK